jgi:mRNA interferase MazF
LVKKTHQYDIVLVGLDPTIGSEMKKTRPCVILSPDELNEHLRTVIIAPLTSTDRVYPFRVAIHFQNKKGAIAIDQIRTVDKARLIKKLGALESKKITELKDKLNEMFVV